MPHKQQEQNENHSIENPLSKEQAIQFADAQMRVGICTTITITKEITWTLIENLLVDALEGGSNYWYLLDNYSRAEQQPSEPISMYISRMLYKDRMTFTILDTEDSKEQLGILSKDNIIKSFELLKGIPHVFKNIIIDDNYDANDADVWFQLVVMQKVVYG